MTQHPPAISSLCWWLDVARPWALMLRRFLRELSAFGGTCSSRFNVSLQCQGHKQVLSSCMPGYFSFDFKNSILLACSQGCYSALQLATVQAADKRGGFYMVYPNSALLGLSDIYLNFISVWLLIYKKASFFFFSKITLYSYVGTWSLSSRWDPLSLWNTELDVTWQAPAPAQNGICAVGSRTRSEKAHQHRSSKKHKNNTGNEVQCKYLLCDMEVLEAGRARPASGCGLM